MADHQKILEAISVMTDAGRLRSTIRNAKAKGVLAVEEAAFRRLVAIQPRDAPGTLEHDFWQTIYAFEELLTEERGKTTRLSRTRQKIDRVGVKQTLIDFATSISPTSGFTMLIERNLPDLTGEAIVLNHWREFEATTVAAAAERLRAAGVNTDKWENRE